MQKRTQFSSVYAPPPAVCLMCAVESTRWQLSVLRPLLVIAVIASAALSLEARAKSGQDSYGQGLNVRVAASERDVLQAVRDIVADGIIQGSKEYNKDEYVSGAEQADRPSVFPPWTGPGQAFYKIRNHALDPRNFKDSGDSGTLAVRYVVQRAGEKETVLQIDALFVDDLHHRNHPSNGSVEAAEYKDIQDHLAKVQVEKQQAAEQAQRRQEEQAETELKRRNEEAQRELAIAESPDETLEQHVRRLRHEVERLVRAPGAQLKSAPFRSASSLKSLPVGAQVVILISTPYWYGIETEDGQHGWVHRSQLDQLP
ncbi:MAG: SH3 domain-containing protein [Acidobacteria bacterium]|nr:SH3 domain-containing protein [Acidobacteriota bacterium]